MVTCLPPRHTADMGSIAQGAMTNGLRRLTTAPATDDTFEEVVLPHLDAGYRLARWLLRNEHDAEDAVQEASLRALRYFRTFAGGNGRAWFLRVVRHVCWSWRDGSRFPTDPFNEERHGAARSTFDPEMRLMQIENSALVDRAMGSLPDRFRELLVLRELEGLSYQQMADVVGIPIGTVMSGLSRARRAFRRALAHERKQAGIQKHNTFENTRAQEARM